MLTLLKDKYANLGLIPNVVSCHLAHRRVKIGGGFRGGFGNPFQNSLSVDLQLNYQTKLGNSK